MRPPFPCRGGPEPNRPPLPGHPPKNSSVKTEPERLWQEVRDHAIKMYTDIETARVIAGRIGI